jgi:hypothetical protein
MLFIYSNHSDINGLPRGEIFRIDAPNWQEADRLFFVRFPTAINKRGKAVRLEKFSQDELAYVSMYSPEWPVNRPAASR